jgi:hypothetical protein
MQKIPVYRRAEGLPDVPYFDCTDLHASLTVTTCASLWRAAADPHRMRYSTCRACPLGGRHAGIANVASGALRGLLVCSRCYRTSRRLILSNLCVSCYNRQREVVRGKNARGLPPTKLTRLDARAVCYAEGGRVRTVRSERTVSATELLVGTLRDAVQVVAFGWRGSRAQMRQGRLW